MARDLERLLHKTAPDYSRDELIALIERLLPRRQDPQQKLTRPVVQVEVPDAALALTASPSGVPIPGAPSGELWEWTENPREGTSPRKRRRSLSAL